MPFEGWRTIIAQRHISIGLGWVMASACVQTASLVGFALSQVMLGQRRVDTLAFSAMPVSQDILGYKFFARFGVVGFNFQTREMGWYRS